MAQFQSYVPRYDIEPLLDEVSVEDGTTDADRPLAPRSTSARGYVLAMVGVLAACCLLAGATKEYHDGAFSRTAAPAVYAEVSAGGSHKIVSKSSGKCLDWANVIVGLKECDAANPKEMWTYADNHIEAPNGQCLDMGGKDVHVWKCDMAAGDAIENNQHWKFDEATGEIRHHAKDNVCLAASGSGAKVTMEACDKGSKGQKWHVHVHALPKLAAKGLDKQSAETETAEKSKRAEKEHAEKEHAEKAGGGPSMEIPIMLGLLLVAVAMGALYVWRGQQAGKQQSRELKAEDGGKDVEAAAAEQPEQQPEEEAEAAAEAAEASCANDGLLCRVDFGRGFGPVAAGLVGPLLPAASAESGAEVAARATEASEAGQPEPQSEEVQQPEEEAPADSSGVGEAAEGSGGSPFEEAAAQEAAAEPAEDVPAPREAAAAEAAAEAAEAAPEAAEGAGAAAEDQPPPQEEPQEQAAPQAAQAAPEEPGRPAPAPKKSGKKCTVM